MFVIAWWTLIIRYIFAYAKETASATLVYLCVCVKICVGVCVLNFGFLKSKTFPVMLITRLPANLCWVNVSIWVSVKNCKWRTHLLEFICFCEPRYVWCRLYFAVSGLIVVIVLGAWESFSPTTTHMQFENCLT